MLSNLYIPWCNFCQNAPSDGKLTVIVDGEDHPVKMDACEECARKAFDTHPQLTLY